MPEYRRSFIPGGTYFFTVITYNRRPIFNSENARSLLRLAWKDVEKRFPFTTVAICLLPDHLHCIWTLPDADDHYSIRWKEIKRLFSKSYNPLLGINLSRSPSREKRMESIIWQRRFWEHTICDEDDFHTYLDYIHYNPVKHHLVQNVKDWRFSSFCRFVRLGYYDLDWGSAEPVNDSALFGE